MKADYKNWVPKGMIYGLGAATVGLIGAALGMKHLTAGALNTLLSLKHYVRTTHRPKESAFKNATGILAARRASHVTRRDPSTMGGYLVAYQA